MNVAVKALELDGAERAEQLGAHLLSSIMVSPIITPQIRLSWHGD